MSTRRPSSLGRALRLGVIALACVFVTVQVTRIPGLGEKDWLVYWSASRLLLRGQNPYDPALLRQTEAAALPARARLADEPVASWNPPWLLVGLLPLAALPIAWAVRVWLVCNTALIAAAGVATWRWLGGRLDRPGLLLAVGSALWFGQSSATIRMGQISTLLLLGLVLAAWALEHGRDDLAGAALWLVAVKPHVTYLPLLLVAWQVVARRRWRVVRGAAVTGAACAAVLFALYPSWLAAYLRLVTAHSFLQYSTATVGGLVYAWTGHGWGRYLGVLTLPLLPWLARQVHARGWLPAINLALLVSVPVAPYGFGFDHVVLVPAIIELNLWLRARVGASRAARALAVGLVAANVALLITLTRPLPYHCYTWFPIALGMLYATGSCMRAPITVARAPVI